MVVGSISTRLMRNMDKVLDVQNNALLKQMQEIPFVLAFFIFGKCSFVLLIENLMY